MSKKAKRTTIFKVNKKSNGFDKTCGKMHTTTDKVNYTHTGVRITKGQKVILYTTDGRHIVDIYGRNLGPKQIVLGSGYVCENEGGFFVNTKKLGKVIITQEKNILKADRKEIGTGMGDIYVKCVEE